MGYRSRQEQSFSQPRHILPGFGTRGGLLHAGPMQARPCARSICAQRTCAYSTCARRTCAHRSGIYSIFAYRTCARNICVCRRAIISTLVSSRLLRSIEQMQKASRTSQRGHELHPPLYHPSGTIRANPSRDAAVYPKAKCFVLPLQSREEALGRTGTCVGEDRG